MIYNNSTPLINGKTMEMILNDLVHEYGWEKLGKIVTIECFKGELNMDACLKYLRKTPWARKKVENLYKMTVKV